MSLSATANLQSTAVANGETAFGNHDKTGKFVNGNRAATGRRKSVAAPVEIPPAPEAVARAGLSQIWASVFQRAAMGSSRHVSLVLQLRRSTFGELTGIDDFYDECDDPEIRELMRDLQQK